MPKYTVSFLPEAVDDILRSYEWGVENWGEDAAEKWLRDLYRSIYRILEASPFGCPLAPENESWDSEMRQLVFLRYRILFTVLRHEKEGVVVRVSGPYSGYLD
jgi:plasmid stabilization system protein ParE